MKRKLSHNDRGETLVEVLASILIAVMSVSLLLSCVTASTQVDIGARGLDKAHFAAMNKAERQTDADKVVDLPTGTTVKVAIKRVNEDGSLKELENAKQPQIDIYGGEEMMYEDEESGEQVTYSLYSYKAATSAGGGGG